MESNAYLLKPMMIYLCSVGAGKMNLMNNPVTSTWVSKEITDNFAASCLTVDPERRLQIEVLKFTNKMSSLERMLVLGDSLDESNLDKISPLISSLCEACADYNNYASSDEIAAARAWVQESIKPWTSQSWFMNQAINRPRGYPGDFEILEGFYDNQVKSKKGIGSAFDEWILQTPLVQSVRGRKEKCKEILEELVVDSSNQHLRLMKVSSGPCRELQESKILRDRQGLFFYGIDRDDVAVSYANNALLQAGYDQNSILFEKKIACRVRSKNYLSQGNFDIAYCTGLYDFLPDKALVSLFSGVSNLLAEDGMHLIVLKDGSKYDITSCEWVVSWSFFERTEQKCRNLIDQAGLKVEKMWRDHTEIMMFFLAKTK
jgi:hypothetical protein